jgi:hypothetical protein
MPFSTLSLYVKTLYLTAVAIHFPSAGLTYRTLWRRAGQRHVAAAGRWIIWCSLKPKFLKLFPHRKGLVYILKGRVQNLDYFRSNSFAFGIRSFLAPHFRLFQWRLRAPYRLEPRPAAWLPVPYFDPLFKCNEQGVCQEWRASSCWGRAFFNLNVLNKNTVCLIVFDLET